MTPFDTFCFYRAFKDTIQKGWGFAPYSSPEKYKWQVAWDKQQAIRTNWKKVSNKHDPVAYIVGNFYVLDKWSLNSYQDANMAIAVGLRSIGPYKFEQELKFFTETLFPTDGYDKLKSTDDKGQPVYVSLYKGGSISLHCATVLDALLESSINWHPELPLDKEVKNKVRNMFLFVTKPSQLDKYKTVFENCLKISLND